jgi:hypothetical protein
LSGQQQQPTAALLLSAIVVAKSFLLSSGNEENKNDDKNHRFSLRSAKIDLIFSKEFGVLPVLINGSSSGHEEDGNGSNLPRSGFYASHSSVIEELNVVSNDPHKISSSILWGLSSTISIPDSHHNDDDSQVSLSLIIGFTRGRSFTFTIPISGPPVSTSSLQRFFSAGLLKAIKMILSPLIPSAVLHDDDDVTGGGTDDICCLRPVRVNTALVVAWCLVPIIARFITSYTNKK